MTSLRTPDHRFADLPDYHFAPHYATVDPGLRMHYLDENPAATRTVVLLHGEPSWSFLYRHMIPPLAAAGFRVIAPDLIGFGRSDKPTEDADYTYARHVKWVRELLFDHLDLSAVHLFCQDWGGLIGLRLLAEHPARFARVAAGNTFLPTGDRPASPVFLQWREMAATLRPFPVGNILQMATLRELSAAEIAAYDAPFPDEDHKAGVRTFPQLVPITPNNPAAAANREAWQVLRQMDIPFLTLFSDADPITKGAEKILQAEIPGAKGQDHRIVSGGHFLQEDAAEELAKLLVTFFGD